MNKTSMLTAKEIGSRWKCHRTTVIRILEKFGCYGMKSGTEKQSLRRFEASEVMRVESLLRFSVERPGNSGPNAGRQ